MLRASNNKLKLYRLVAYQAHAALLFTAIFNVADTDKICKQKIFL